MALLKLFAAAAASYVIYRYAQKQKGADDPVAFAPGEATGGHEVRNAGADAMRSDPPQWDEVDDASDASFPASDPPAAGKFT